MHGEPVEPSVQIIGRIYKLAHNYYGRKDLWDSKIVFRCKQTKVGVVHALPVIECCGLYAKHKQNEVL
jgi:hypothetical protein